MTSLNKNSSFKVYGLHGFLGKPADWNSFDSITNPLTLTHNELPFWQWAKKFNSELPLKEKKILVGYSMGGRLAMHLLIDNPASWAGAVLISAHPGLTTEEERAKRRESDRLWSERFLHDPWDILMLDWNQNPVFSAQPFPSPRLENEFNRQALAQQLTNWSLGQQEDLLPKMQTLDMPILFLAGENDKKFALIAEQFSTFAQVSIVPGASHRVPWDRPELFEKTVKSFTERIANEQPTSLD